MRKRLLGAMLALLVAAAFFGSSADAAEMNGPMSSTKKPEQPALAVPEAQPPADPKPALDAEKLFAGTCGWCHSGGGRAAGKGPKLMDTALTDAEIVQRIKVGKTGAMPSFATAFNEAELQAIVKYIRGLREDGPAK
ncbi:MAG: cytochrome c [Pseudomonadota bacterium]|nr:cytochrome c [Pseudomonadota bacterium]